MELIKIEIIKNAHLLFFHCFLIINASETPLLICQSDAIFTPFSRLLRYCERIQFSNKSPKAFRPFVEAYDILQNFNYNINKSPFVIAQSIDI